MAELLVPTIQMDRKPNTKTTEMAESIKSPEIDLKSVPNFAAGWLAAGSAAFDLADTIDYSINAARAQNTLNEFRMNVDERTTKMMVDNTAGYTESELQEKVFSGLDEYAQKTFMNQEFMNDPRIRDKMLNQYNDYVHNISNTIKSDNTRKVHKTLGDTLSSTFMLSMNDASTALDTPDSAKYMSIAKNDYDELMRFNGVSPDSEIAKAGWMEQESKIRLLNTLQSIEDKTLNWRQLSNRLDKWKGQMVTDDYIKARRAVNNLREQEEAKYLATLSRKNALTFAEVSGNLTDEQKWERARQLTITYLEKQKNDPNGRFKNMDEKQIRAAAARDVELQAARAREEHTAEGLTIVSTIDGVNALRQAATSEQWGAVVNEVKQGFEIDDVTGIQMLMLASKGLMPSAADEKIKNNTRLDAQQLLDIISKDGLTMLRKTVDRMSDENSIKVAKARPASVAALDTLSYVTERDAFAAIKQYGGDATAAAQSLGIYDENAIYDFSVKAKRGELLSDTDRREESAKYAADLVYKAMSSRFDKSYTKNAQGIARIKGRIREAIQHLAIQQVNEANQQGNPTLKTEEDFYNQLAGMQTYKDSIFQNKILGYPEVAKFRKL